MKTLKIILYLNLILIVLCISSCSDDPVAPSQEFDPPRYDWTIDTINAYIFDMWAKDTDKVFFADPIENLIFYNGANYQYHNYGGDLIAYSLDGYDENNIYLGGLESNSKKAMLKKWNGLSFENIIVSDSSNPKTAIKSTFINSPDEIWLGTLNGHVFKYNGSSFESYYFDTLMRIGPFLKDVTNNIYFVGGIIYENFPNADSAKTFIYKFNSNKWDLVYYKLFNNNTSDTMLSISNVGYEITGVNYNGIRKFNGSDFQKIVIANGFSLSSRYSGFSLFDLLSSGTRNGYIQELYHWNGAAWSIENVELEFQIQRVYGINKMYYCVTNDFLTYKALLFKGKPVK